MAVMFGVKVVGANVVARGTSETVEIKVPTMSFIPCKNLDSSFLNLILNN